MRQPPRMRDIDHLTDRDVAIFYMWVLRLKAICDHHALVKECRENRKPRWTRGLDAEPKLVGWHPVKRDRPRCGARTRAGAPCKAPAVAGGKRCRIHGGCSTGPKTPEGKTRSLAAANAGWQRWNAERQAAKARSGPSEQGKTQPE
jgi:hypothetical protein